MLVVDDIFGSDALIWKPLKFCLPIPRSVRSNSVRDKERSVTENGIANVQSAVGSILSFISDLIWWQDS